MTNSDYKNLQELDVVLCISSSVEYFTQHYEYKVHNGNDGNLYLLDDDGDKNLEILEKNLDRFIVKTKTQKGLDMNVSQQVNKNKDAVILAAKLTAGKALNTKVIKLVTPKLPMLLQGYAKHPLASVVLANVVGMAIQQYASNNEKAKQVAELMLNASAVQALDSFNIDEILDSLLDGIKLPETEE